MKHLKAKRSTRTLATATSQPSDRYLLRLYVAGTSLRSREAILRARALCAHELKGRCRLEVIDIYQQPVRARDGQIIATPTLVKELPLPMRRIIGTLSKAGHLFIGLGLDAADTLGP